MNSCPIQAVQSPARLHLWKDVATRSRAGQIQLWPLHGRAEPPPPVAQPSAEQPASTEPGRRSPPPLRRAEFRCFCGRGHHDPVASGVCLHLHCYLAVARPPAAQTAACLVPPPVAAERLLPESLRVPALRVRVPYRRRPAAVGRARVPLLPSPALFCGASSARSSICACLACNTPAGLRAIRRTNPVSEPATGQA